MSTEYYKLKIKNLKKETRNATSVIFEIAADLKEKFKFKPGQHINVKFTIEGEEARRSYSISSSPNENKTIQITVKKVKSGLVSNFINTKLNEKNEVLLTPPNGKFLVNIDPINYKHYFLFASGSGITPIFSIIRTVLSNEPHSFVTLFYGNKNKSNIIFYKELEKLHKNHQERFNAVHTLTSPYSDWASVLGWEGRKGRIDDEAIRWFIAKYPPRAQSTEYYICGPGRMNVDVRNTLLSLGIPKDLVHIEQFLPLEDEVQNIENVVDSAELVFKLDGRQGLVKVHGDESILAVLKRENMSPPYSCESGVCSTCKARLIKGKVQMKASFGLDDDEVNNGYILTCQSYPATEKIEISYDL